MATARSIDGLTVCVTGASSGIGRSIAGHLGSLGAHVFLMGRTEEPMRQQARATGSTEPTRPSGT